MAQQDHQNLYGVHDLDFDNITHYLANTLGNGVISGLAVTQRGAGANMSVDVATGDARADGTVRNFASVTNVTITAAHGTLPRKDLIVINSAGSLVTRDGTAEAATPSGQVRRFTLTPSPADLTDGDLVLAEVWVAAAVTQIFNADISSRAINAELPNQDIWLPVVTADPVVGSPTLVDVSVGTPRWQAMSFDPDTDEAIEWSFIVPRDWDESSAFTVKLYWLKITGATNEVFWLLTFTAVAGGENLDSPSATTIFNGTRTTPGTDILEVLNAGTIAASALSIGDIVDMSVRREATEGGDDFVADALVLGVLIEYTTG